MTKDIKAMTTNQIVAHLVTARLHDLASVDTFLLQRLSDYIDSTVWDTAALNESEDDFAFPEQEYGLDTDELSFLDLPGEDGDD